MALTAGNRHEHPEAIPLLTRLVARWQPAALAGDRAYSSPAIRGWLTQHAITAVIPYRKDEAGDRVYDRELYRDRSRIEHTVNRLKRFRRVATRSEKVAAQFLAMATLAMILDWL